MAGSGLPVPSNQSTDRSVNTENVDKFVNSTEDTFKNRTSPNGNVNTRTIQGINNEFDQFLVDGQDKIDDAINRLGGIDKGNYEDDVQLTELGDYAVYQRGTSPTYWKVVDGTVIPYQIDSATYPTPDLDPNLQQFNDVNSLTLKNYTDLVFDNVNDMIAYPNKTLGDQYSTGGTSWRYNGGTTGTIDDFNHVSPYVVLDDFSVIGDCQDNGVGTDNTDNIRIAMDYGRNNPPVDFIAKGRAYKTRDFVVPNGVRIIGMGLPKWDLPSHGYNYELDGGTTFLIFGACDNPVNIRGITDMSASGGVVPNPDSEVSGDANYSLLNFMNNDATSVSAATPKDLKVGILLEDQNYNSALVNCRVMLNNNGINGYNDSVSTGLGDDWDIGVLSLNSKFNSFEYLQSVGYWRMAAMCQVNVSNGNIPQNGAIYNNHKGCYYQGFKGLSVRGNDVYRITAISSTSVEIPWTTSNPFEHGGGKFMIGGAEFTYGSISVSGDKLTFSSLSGDPSLSGSVGDELAYGTNIGVASFNVDEQTCITDLQHRSRTAAHYLGFQNPSCSVEVSGFPLRDVEIQAHMFSTDNVMHIHDAQHIDLPMTFVEATGWKKSPSGPFEPQGARFICSDGNYGDYPAGKCDTLNYPHSAEWNSFVDFAPMERSSSMTRYSQPESTGLFRPSGVRFLPKGPYTSDLPFRAYNGFNTIATKNGGLRIVNDSPFNSFVEFLASNQSMVVKPNDFGGVNIEQQEVGKDPRLRLVTQTNGVTLDFLIDDDQSQKAQLRRSGKVILDLENSGIYTTNSDPNGSVTANPGSICLSSGGGAGTSFYVKESGTGNTGWVAK